MCNCIRTPHALPVYSIFMLTLHWKRFPFHAHLVLDNSPRQRPRGSVVLCTRQKFSLLGDNMNGFARAAALSVALCLCVFTAWAQTPTGSIEGSVTDPTGAVVPGAKVTVTENETGRSIPLTTNEMGLYS